MEDRIVDIMKQLGFTGTDARTYVALLKSHPATGYELAARSGVPRSAIYGVLRRLEANGLVNAIQDKPAKFTPLPPDDLFEMLDSRFSRSLDELKSSLAGLASRTPVGTVWTVQGYQPMLEQAVRLIGSSQQSVCASIWRREADLLATPLRSAVGAGIDVVLFSFNPLPPDVGRVLSYGISEEDLQKYWSHRLILISDRKRVLVAGAEPGDDSRGVVAEEAALVEMAISNLVLDVTLYGQRTGEDIHEVVTALTAHLAPVEEMLGRTSPEA